MDDAIEDVKYCPDCRRYRLVSEFTKNRRSKDGLAFYCRPCRIRRDEQSRRRRLGPPRIRVRPRDVVVPEGSKWCPRCGEVKMLEEYPRNRSETSGYMSYCKPCFNDAARESRELRHGSTRNYHLKHRYGITEADFDRMFAEQNGVCVICREAPAEHVDHDHVTGRVRGLQWGSPRQSGRSRRGSFNCNGALGQFRDRTDLMLQAVAYLRGGDWQSAHELPGVTVCLALVNEDPDSAPPADAA